MRQVLPVPLGRGAKVFRRSLVVSGIPSPSVRKRTRFVADSAGVDNGTPTAPEGVSGVAPGERPLAGGVRNGARTGGGGPRRRGRSPLRGGEGGRPPLGPSRGRLGRS